jgi:hypothetical protein
VPQIFSLLGELRSVFRDLEHRRVGLVQGRQGPVDVALFPEDACRLAGIERLRDEHGRVDDGVLVLRLFAVGELECGGIRLLRLDGRFVGIHTGRGDRDGTVFAADGVGAHRGGGDVPVGRTSRKDP